MQRGNQVGVQEVGGITGCRAPGKEATGRVDLQNSKSAALGVTHRALCK